MLAATPLAAASRAPIIDSHLHVWTNDTARFPFAHPNDRNFKPPPIAGTAEAALEEMDEHGIDAAVLVQVIYYGWDNRFLADCLRKHPSRFRGQGLIDPTDPKVADRLEYWMREHKLSGMRFSPIYYQGRDEWMTSEAHHRLWKKAAELDAIFNFFLAAPQLASLDTMLTAHPDVRVVIDHLARVDLAHPDAGHQIKQLTSLARHRNLWVKISELSVLSPSKRAPYTDTFDCVKYVYDAFGPDRLLFGTGFPGATRAQAGRPALAEELDLIRHDIPFFTAADREKILGGNAAKLWRI